MDGGLPNNEHIERDTGGKYVLISKEFYYFGNKSPEIPNDFVEVCCEGRGMKSPAIPSEIANNFISWIAANYNLGIHGDPISWKKHK